MGTKNVEQRLIETDRAFKEIKGKEALALRVKTDRLRRAREQAEAEQALHRYGEPAHGR
jgi:hypothetical protein